MDIELENETQEASPLMLPGGITSHMRRRFNSLSPSTTSESDLGPQTQIVYIDVHETESAKDFIMQDNMSTSASSLNDEIADDIRLEATSRKSSLNIAQATQQLQQTEVQQTQQNDVQEAQQSNVQETAPKTKVQKIPTQQTNKDEIQQLDVDEIQQLDVFNATQQATTRQEEMIVLRPDTLPTHYRPDSFQEAETSFMQRDTNTTRFVTPSVENVRAAIAQSQQNIYDDEDRRTPEEWETLLGIHIIRPTRYEVGCIVVIIIFTIFVVTFFLT